MISGSMIQRALNPVGDALDDITAEVMQYKAAEDALLTHEAVLLTIEQEFEQELLRVESIQHRIALRTQELLTTMGIEQTSKKAGAVQEAVRKNLFVPVSTVYVQDKERFEGKALNHAGATITLVQQKQKLKRVDDSLDAHKHDVQLLLDNNMWTSLEIKADDDTLAFMRLREKNEEESLQSVEIIERGYCKVKVDR